MGRRILGLYSRRFLKEAQRIGILFRTLVLSGYSQRRKVKQVSGTCVIRVQVPRMPQRGIRLFALAELEQRRSVQRNHLEQVWPALRGVGQRRARILKAIQLEVQQRQ